MLPKFLTFCVNIYDINSFKTSQLFFKHIKLLKLFNLINTVTVVELAISKYLEFHSIRTLCHQICKNFKVLESIELSFSLKYGMEYTEIANDIAYFEKFYENCVRNILIDCLIYNNNIKYFEVIFGTQNCLFPNEFESIVMIERKDDILNANKSENNVLKSEINNVVCDCLKKITDIYPNKKNQILNNKQNIHQTFALKRSFDL